MGRGRYWGSFFLYFLDVSEVVNQYLDSQYLQECNPHGYRKTLVDLLHVISREMGKCVCVWEGGQLSFQWEMETYLAKGNIGNQAIGKKAIRKHWILSPSNPKDT